MSRAFQRRVEDFRCERCGAAVRGDGYTNHCPVCLWSRHVDVAPGDRAAECGGLMEPVGVLTHCDPYVILHRCQRCGAQRRNRVSPADAFEGVLELARRVAEAPGAPSAGPRTGHRDRRRMGGESTRRDE